MYIGTKKTDLYVRKNIAATRQPKSEILNGLNHTTGS